MPFSTFCGLKSSALGHFGLVGPGGQRYLSGSAIRRLLHLDAKSGRKFLSGDKQMTTSTSNRHTSNTEDTIVEAGHSHGITTSAALYCPSLIGNCWDDELLPSGD
jgi:hypothetical protein